eukprot:m.40346 g.40346  ORF g.40346 m.40346 type:complete len:421 (+) comp10346_c0_seq3:192-1454(+)
MLQVQSDWNQLGNEDEMSSTTAPFDIATPSRDKFAIVEVVIPDGDGVATEKFLDESTPLNSNDLSAARQSWDRTMFRHLRAQFMHNAGKLRKKIKGKGKGKGKEGKDVSTGNNKDGVKRKQAVLNKRVKKDTAAEFWFTSPTAGSKQGGDVRLKFVNRDEYTVVKEKQGWLDVKEKGKKRSRWVVYQEDTLNYYKDPADTEPVFLLTNVADCELDLKKGKKEKMTIKLRKDKIKTSLLCENDVMADKWYNAITQGKSGQKENLKLKSDVVELIPEYTEEEELADITNALSFKKLQSAGDGGYLTVESLRGAENGGDGDDDYMSLEDITMDVMMNEEGDYLTVETMQSLLEDAGYLTIDEMNALADKDGGYIDVSTIKEVARDAGYMTAEEVHALMGDEDDDDVDFGYLTTTEMQDLMDES